MLTASVARPRMTNTLTIAMLSELLDEIPPKETWVSSELFPADQAWRFATSGENVTCAHPDFWDQFADTGGDLPELVYLDPQEDDGALVAATRAVERDRIMRLVAQALGTRH